MESGRNVERVSPLGKRVKWPADESKGKKLTDQSPVVVGGLVISFLENEGDNHKGGAKQKVLEKRNRNFNRLTAEEGAVHTPKPGERPLVRP